MEGDKGLGSTGQRTDAPGVVAQFAIALGVDDQHRLTAQDGLGDEQIEQPGLARAGGPDHQEMPFQG